MIIIDATDTDGHTFKLRGIALEDAVALAYILRDRADDGSGKYRLAHAYRDTDMWMDQNDAFTGLPAENPLTLTWMLDYDGMTVAFVRIGYWFYQAHVLYTAVNPQYRNRGIMKQMIAMVMKTIEPFGAQTLTFEALESAPAVTAFAATYLGLDTPTEQRIGDTKQTVSMYTFNADDYVARLKVATDIDVAVEIEGLSALEAKAADAVPAEQADVHTP